MSDIRSVFPDLFAAAIDAFFGIVLMPVAVAHVAQVVVESAISGVRGPVRTSHVVAPALQSPLADGGRVIAGLLKNCP